MDGFTRTRPGPAGALARLDLPDRAAPGPLPACVSAPLPRIGDVLDGRLRIRHLLGTGAECDVYAAWDVVRSEVVALKMVRHANLDDAIVRLRAEALPLAEVRHPHLVRLFDAGVTEARCYLILEALDPEPWSARIQRAPRDPGRVVEVISQVAEALEALHRAGWVHGDVKAENILFNADDRAVLTDLGLAQSATVVRNARGVCCGTPAYMAPELILGAERPDGRAVDQYALAVTAHLALTGELPFARSNSYATLFAHAQSPVPAASAANPALAPFDLVLRQAMAKDPGARFASVGELARALREALDEAR